MGGVALVGAGYMAGVHAEAWAAESPSAVRWLCSPSERGRELAAKIGARWTSSIDEAIADSSVTILDICTPTPTHPALVEAGLGAGKHVLVEKPVALDEAGLARVRDAYGARRDGQILMVAHVLPFFGGYRRLLDEVAAGSIGEPLSVVATRFSESPGWTDWITREAQSGGPLVDLLVHDFDIANRLLGTPNRVFAQATPEGGFTVTVNFAGGRTALVAGGSFLPTGTPFSSSIQVAGTDGILSHGFTAAAADTRPTPLQLTQLTASGARLIDVEETNPFRAQLRYFLDCIASGRQPETGSLDSAAAALGVARAALRSRDSGRPEDPADAS